MITWPGTLYGMAALLRSRLTDWTFAVPVLAVLVLIVTWGRNLPGPVIVVVALLLGGAVLAAVHHAEVVAHRVGSRTGRWCSPSRSP